MPLHHHISVYKELSIRGSVGFDPWVPKVWFCILHQVFLYLVEFFVLLLQLSYSFISQFIILENRDNLLSKVRLHLRKKIT